MATSIPMLADDNDEYSTDQQQNPSDASKSASFIAKQAQEIFQKAFPFRRRHNTYFYTVVLGGNTLAVQETADYMNNNGMKDILEWLLDKTDSKTCTRGTSLRSWSTALTRCTIFLMSVLYNIITTPVFYAIHTVAYSVLNHEGQRISKNIQLPLAYAMFSQEKEMWTYFLRQGVSVMDSDCNGNNVFHYIADVSAESSDRAVAMFKMTIQFINDMDSVKILLLEKTNSAGLSAIEYVAKFGSPDLMSEVLEYPNLLRHMVLAVRKDNITVQGNEVPQTEENNSPFTGVDHIDVSRYECGSLEHRSSLLNFLSDRNLMLMSREDLNLF